MIVARTLDDLRAAVAALPRPVALAPTMGALHAGHMALVAAGLQQAASVAASIFVNPLQFASATETEAYPRDEAADLAMLEAGGCALVWAPSVAEMYPSNGGTRIETSGPSIGFESAHRPGHFAGVTTVVGKLLHQVGPDVVLFGEKDWQQTQVVRQMIEDLDWPVRMALVPTVREHNGLAMSSRNRLLTREQRYLAPTLYRVLQQSARILAGGAIAGVTAGAAMLVSAGMPPDYFSLVDARTMELLDLPVRPARLVAAARLGQVRLLDNVPVPAWDPGMIAIARP